MSITKLKVIDKREYISYSELSTWLGCHWRHKLKYLDKIELDKPTIFTEYGRTIHNALESYLTTKKMPDTKDVLNEFLQSLKENQIEEDEKKLQKEFIDAIDPILKAVPDFMKNQFGDWTFVSAEHQLLEEIGDDRTTKKFKGFIDGVITAKRSHRCKTAKPEELEYWLVDWKVTGWGWDRKKKIDPHKTLQLALYKKFFASKFGLELSNIKCGFALLKRVTKRDRCEFVPVSVGPKMLEFADNTIASMIGFLDKGLYPKNIGKECDYCVYRGTKHCP